MANWTVHYVFETELCEFGGLCNYHTHGLKENYDHLDFQVVLPLNPKTIDPILGMMVNQIKEGRVFESDKKAGQVLRGFDVLFKEFHDGNRKVLRLILPDPNGKFPGDEGCQEPYSRQLEELPLV
ncbi:DUF4262 domain-containing protein [Bacillus sp. FJAT-29937]|uniref:DUF4262 domain-containing protein n=1 Tax=Bacillus sp. FJAT-29937 TaxID=1720553 RepID=UPI00082D81BE|nr:DUF4262 domain-containing protein [Bacillus sp. FJAT-29937]